MNEKDRRSLIDNLEKSVSFTSLREEKQTPASSQSFTESCIVPNEIVEENADFFATLDADGVVQIGNYYYRVDYCNKKVYVLNAESSFISATDWSDFLSGNTSNPNIGWFHSYVDVLEAIAEGYITMPDSSLAAGNEIFIDSGPIENWHEDFRLVSSPNIDSSQRLDGKIEYLRLGIFFHFLCQ
jgi:hypothetical protein